MKNLLLNSKIVTKLLLLFFLFMMGNIFVHAAPRFSVATGNWNSTATWSATSGGAPGASVPVAGDAVTIEGGFNVTVTADATCTSITFTTATATSLTINTGITLTVSGAITIPRSGAGVNLIAVGAGNLNAASISFTSGGGAVRHQITISTGTVTISGNVTQTASTGSASFTFTGAGLLRLGGTFLTSTTGTLTPSTGTVEYYGTAQTIQSFVYNNLTLSGSGIKTIGATATVNGILSMEGTATASAAPTYGGSATLQYNTSVNRTITGLTNAGIEWITPFVATGGVVIANTGKITLGIARTINSGSKITINSLSTLDPGGFVHTISGGASLIVNGTLDFSNATGEIRSGTTGTSTLTMGTSGFIRTIDTNGLGPLASASFSTQTGGAWNVSSLSTNGTIEYYRASGGSSVITDRDYNNLIISGTPNTKTWTLGSNRTVSGNLTISASASFTLANTQTLFIKGNWSNSATFNAGTSTVTFSGTTAQTISGATTFNNLTDSNTSNPLVFGAIVTVSNNLSVAASASLNLGTFSHSAGTLTLDGFGTASGSFGSTSSSATYKTNTFFAATTGIVNVTTGSCGTIAAVLSGTNTICNGASSNLNVAVTGGVSTYTLVYSGGTVNNYSSGSNISVNPSSTTVYSLTSVTDSYGCTATLTGTPTVTVRANFTSGAITTTGETICNGGTPATTIGSATAASGGDTTFTYSWRNSADSYTAAISGATGATYLPPAGLTTTTSYRRYANDGTCNVTPTVSTGTWTVTVNDTFASGAITTTGETICNGGTPATTIGSDTAASGGDTTITYSWRSSADSYAAAISGATSATYLPPAGLTTTTSYRRYANDGTCNVTPTVSTGTWTVTVNQPSGDPTSASASITTICNGGSSILTLNGGGGGGAIATWYTSSCGGTLVGTGNGLVVSPTSTTTYYGRYEGSCNTTTCSSVTITVGTATTTWDGSAWDNGEPDASTAAIISGTYTSGTTNPSVLTACKLNVTNNATVVIKDGDSVTLNGPLAVDTGCFVTFNSGAILLQSGISNANSGAIVIKRNSVPLKRLDYTLWSSPVAGQQLQAFSPNTLSNRFYRYDTSNSIYQAVDPTTTNFTPLNGFLIRSPNTHSVSTPAIWPGEFVGVPNNGDYSLTLQNFAAGYRYNLIGNPYPSAIDANTFIQTNLDNGSITGTLYLWRKTNGAANGAYCTYSLGGFVGNGETVLNQSQYDDQYANIIQVGQGFFVEGTGSGSVVVTNAMRINTSVNRFYRSTNTVERNRIWLNITNATGSFSQAMIAYMTGATQGVDPAIDGKLLSDGDVSLASLIGTTSYAIQGRSLPFDMTDVVPLIFKVTTAGDYTITIDHVDGLFSNGAQTVYLRDTTTGIVHDLSAGGYTFTSASGTFDTRFEIIYQAPLAVSTPTFNEGQVVIYKTPTNEISINTGNVVMSMVKIFDITGRLLQEKKGVNASQTVMSCGLANEVLLVQITSETGVVVTKKVLR